MTEYICTQFLCPVYEKDNEVFKLRPMYVTSFDHISVVSI
jgi:hypothetical protein